MAVKAINSKVAKIIATAVAIIPFALFFVLGSVIGSFTTGWYVSLTWLGIFLAWNLDIIRPQEWRVRERFGSFLDVQLSEPQYAGIVFYYLRGLIDRVRQKGTLRERQVLIFRDPQVQGGLEEIDFADGSAPIESYLWIKNGAENASDEAIKADIVRYAYSVESPEDRTLQIAENELRPKLQKLTVDEASERRDEIANDVVEQIKRQLEHYGLYLAKSPSVVIADIGLTEEQKKLRQERLRGSTVADELANEASGYRRAIEHIMYGSFGPDGAPIGPPICSFEEARTLWSEQQTRATFAKTGSNITIIGKSADDVIKTFGVGGVK